MIASTVSASTHNVAEMDRADSYSEFGSDYNSDGIEVRRYINRSDLGSLGPFHQKKLFLKDLIAFFSRTINHRFILAWSKKQKK